MNNDKERLEEAKLMAEMLRVETRLPHDFPFDLVDWLVEQAEQKQSLETTVDFYQSALRDADRRVQELEQELHFCQVTKLSMDSVEKYTEDLKKQNKRYREALEFYAKENNHVFWEDIREGENFVQLPISETDKGYI